MANAASGHTPYNYAFNDPVLMNDPRGDYPPGTVGEIPISGGGATFDGGGGGGGGWGHVSMMPGRAIIGVTSLAANTGIIF